MLPAIDISAIVTNYGTGPLLARCVGSLLEQDLGGRRLEVLVVDNASPEDQEPWLGPVEKQGARVLRLAENRGHGGGCNRGLAATTGRVVLFINSDTIAGPGCLATLAEHLEHYPESGLVEPRTFLDEDHTFLLPQVHPPTPTQSVGNAMSRLSHRAEARAARRRLRRMLPGWEATGPIPQECLTGAFLAGRREVLMRLGGYDEGYPFYYEDTDLCARMRQAGYEVAMVPEAEVTHLCFRSVARQLQTFLEYSRIGRARYLRRFRGAWTAWLDRLLRRLADPIGHGPGGRVPVDDLGTLTGPPRIGVGERGPRLVELTVDAHFTTAACHFVEGGALTMSERAWDSLHPGTWFLRSWNLERMKPEGSWSFRKEG